MANYKSLYTQDLDRFDEPYTEVNENVVRVVCAGGNLKIIPIFVSFDADGAPLVTLSCRAIAKFKDKKLGNITCAKLNERYEQSRFGVEFYIDDNGDIIAKTDCYVDEETCGKVVSDHVMGMFVSVDVSYPTIAKALWC